MRQEFHENQDENLPVVSAESPTLAEENLLEEDANPQVDFVRSSIRRYNRLLFGTMIGMGVVSLFTVSIAHYLINNGQPYLSIPWVMAMMAGLCVAIVRPRSILKRAKEQIKAVAMSEDFESLGAMIEMLNLEKEVNVSDATISVTNILTKIQPEQAGLLSSRHRFTLRNILNRNLEVVLYKDLNALFRPVNLQNEANRRAINLRIAIMKGFAQVGTEAEVSAVERWAKIEAKSEAQQLLKSTAMECLPVLKERVAQLSDQKTLLRASDANHHDPRFLLRPSRETAEPTEQLLRPNETTP